MSLAKHFKKVIATDPSEAQIKNAIGAENISYKISSAENSGLENNSADLVTIANALHWFEFDLFYKEVKRILKPGGVIAAWCYGSPIHLQSKEINELIKKLHDDILGNFWLTENRLVEQKYKTIPFPFKEIEHPDFTMEKELNENDLLGLFHSWSAVQRYKDTKKQDPVAIIEGDLKTAWGKEEKQKFKWELTLKPGRN
ncbi:MAG: class I SAM-dependent methyltransferase [Bacteroidia bacterium]|nr:class I SAM-dependent methyltransferase [Bacteroidia bacterium]